MPGSKSRSIRVLALDTDASAFENLDLRQFAGWCQQRHLRLFQVRRADIECFARDLEAKGRLESLPMPRPAEPVRHAGR